MTDHDPTSPDEANPDVEPDNRPDDTPDQDDEPGEVQTETVRQRRTERR